MLLFFFFKQKTAYEMRISDWSSDVCSSDLRVEVGTPCALAACGGFMNAVTIAAQRGVFFEPFEMHHAIANDARHRAADLMRGQHLKQWRGGHFADGVLMDCNAPRLRFTTTAQRSAPCLVCCAAARASRQ